MTLTKKSQAIKWFGTATKLAEALGISSPSLCEWEEDLTPRRRNEIMGAAISAGLARFVPGAKIRRLEGE